MKVSSELVHEVLTNNQLEPDTIQRVLAQIERQAAAEAEAERANREPVQKKQFVLIVSDPYGKIPKEDFVGWVAQIPEDDPVNGTMDRLFRATYEYNISKKGRKYPCKTVGESCEAVGARFLKEQGISIKNKVPVSIVVTDNRIPKDEVE